MSYVCGGVVVVVVSVGWKLLFCLVFVLVLRRPLLYKASRLSLLFSS